MNKTLKKTLSIILAILMIATTIPFAFAAETESTNDECEHVWFWGYCSNCDEKFPDDAECAHKTPYGGCIYCGYIDETSEVSVKNAYFNGHTFDVCNVRMLTFNKIYGEEMVQEVYNSVNEEAKKQRDETLESFYMLEGTIGENKDAIEEMKAFYTDFADKFKNCLEGVHNVDEYTSNNDATCIANGTKIGDCTFCSAKNITVEDEGTMLSSCYTNDGDSYCDGCGVQILCEDCGRPVHEEEGVPEYLCFIIILIRLIVSFFNAVK